GAGARSGRRGRCGGAAPIRLGACRRGHDTPQPRRHLPVLHAGDSPMIAKELRAARWAFLAGLAIVVLRAADVATTNLHAQTLGSLQSQTDADFSAVAAGQLSTAAADVWGPFFTDLDHYLL